MLKGTSKNQAFEKQYQNLKYKIINLIKTDLRPEEYKALLAELTPALLKFTNRNNITLLWWVVYAAFCGKTELFVDVWNKHNSQLSHFDFCTTQGTHAAPLWYLARMSQTQPRLLSAYFKRFSSDIKVENIIQSHTIDENHQASIFGLIANMAVSHPRTFEEIWPVLKNDLNTNILIKVEQIAGVIRTPIQSLLEATLIPRSPNKASLISLDANIVHFCFEQFGDLRPGFQSEYIVPGNMVKKCSDTSVALLNFASLQQHKNNFFDELIKLKEKPVSRYDNIIALARTALDAGFLNPSYHLAQYFKDQGHLDFMHEALLVLPKGSIYQQNALKKCANWFLSKIAYECNMDKQLKYLNKVLSACLKITDETTRNSILHRAVYFYIHGKEMPCCESASIRYDFLNGVNEKTSLKTLMFALARYKHFLKSGADALTTRFDSLLQQEPNKHQPESEHVPQLALESEQLQPLPKPVIPRMGSADGYTFDPTPHLFNFNFIDHGRYGFELIQSVIIPLTVAENNTFDELTSLMDAQEVMFLMNPAIPYVKKPKPKAVPLETMDTVTQCRVALPLAPELSDIDPLHKYRYR